MNITPTFKFENINDLEDLRQIVEKTKDWPGHSEVLVEYDEITVTGD